MLMHGSTGRYDAPRGNRHGPGRIGSTVTRREHAAFPSAAGCFAPFGCFLRAQHMRRNTDGACKVAPLCPARELVLVLRQIEKAAAAKPCILAGLLCHHLPEIEALRRYRQLARVAVLLAAPAPIAAGLLGGHAPLLKEGDTDSPSCEIIRREDPHHAAADDDDIRLQRWGWAR